MYVKNPVQHMISVHALDYSFEWGEEHLPLDNPSNKREAIISLFLIPLGPLCSWKW